MNQQPHRIRIHFWTFLSERDLMISFPIVALLLEGSTFHREKIISYLS
jgi:hypothetical protein